MPYNQAPPVNYVLSTWLNITFHSISITKAINLLGRPPRIFLHPQHSPLRTAAYISPVNQIAPKGNSSYAGCGFFAKEWLGRRVGGRAACIVFPFNFPFSHVQKALLWRIMLIKSSASQQQYDSSWHRMDAKRHVFRVCCVFFLLQRVKRSPSGRTSEEVCRLLCIACMIWTLYYPSHNSLLFGHCKLKLFSAF